jgi:hypothetical protein
LSNFSPILSVIQLSPGYLEQGSCTTPTDLGLRMPSKLMLEEPQSSLTETQAAGKTLRFLRILDFVVRNPS